jgi:hypothetical protein
MFFVSPYLVFAGDRNTVGLSKLRGAFEPCRSQSTLADFAFEFRARSDVLQHDVFEWRKEVDEFDWNEKHIKVFLNQP